MFIDLLNCLKMSFQKWRFVRWSIPLNMGKRENARQVTFGRHVNITVVVVSFISSITEEHTNNT